jgi:hypothetical protein
MGSNRKHNIRNAENLQKLYKIIFNFIKDTWFKSLYIKNSVASVRKRTMQTERPPLISEVSANFLWIEGAT